MDVLQFPSSNNTMEINGHVGVVNGLILSNLFTPRVARSNNNVSLAHLPIPPPPQTLSFLPLFFNYSLFLTSRLLYPLTLSTSFNLLLLPSLSALTAGPAEPNGRNHHLIIMLTRPRRHPLTPSRRRPNTEQRTCRMTPIVSR